MAYTVKRLASLSGISVRTLHFYDQIDLLKPARYGRNGYRYYEQAQLLMLQQILFYRELGFELRRIKEILSRPRFKKAAALRSHRKVLQQRLLHARNLLETVDKTLNHLQGATPMKDEELFAGFTVAAGEDRTSERLSLRGEPHLCKVSSKDTQGALCVFEVTGHSGGPRHLHHDQDEWIYIVQGQFEFHVGKKQFFACPGESVFLPREVAHAWRCTGDPPGKIINLYQPAGNMEGFFHRLAGYNDTRPVHEELGVEGLHQLFAEHHLRLVGPPLGWDPQAGNP